MFLSFFIPMLWLVHLFFFFFHWGPHSPWIFKKLLENKLSSLRWPVEPSEFVFEETDSLLFVYLQMKPGSCMEDVCLRCSNKCVLLQSKGLGGQRVTHSVAENFSFSSDHVGQLHGLTRVARERGNSHLDRNSVFLLEYNCFAVLCSFPLYNKVNHLYVSIYPLPLVPPSHPETSVFSVSILKSHLLDNF